MSPSDGSQVVVAAIWVRVSTDDQDADNQRARIEQYCKARGFAIARTFRLDDVSGHADTPQYNHMLADCLRAAHEREFSVLILWALDRLTRRGIEHLCGLMRRFDAEGVRVVSLEEPWTESGGELRDLMLAITGWAANFESKRISERTKAGLARRRAEGLPVGRQPGAVDKSKRKRSGYRRRWEHGRPRVNKGDTQLPSSPRT
ncbi:MAG: recombinase family protein [Chloroflexi bacterium]|nr:recombinase family protein [Chloroflexota bacterium]